MEQQLLIFDQGSLFARLPSDAVGRIEKVKKEASARLVGRLAVFWERSGYDFRLLLKHEPRELIPEFETYAGVLYDAIVCELRPYCSRAEQIQEVLPFVSEGLLRQICPPRNIWRGHDFDPPMWHTIENTVTAAQFGSDIDILIDQCEVHGDWERCIAQSFAPHISRLVEMCGQNDLKDSIELERYRVAAVCKFQLHLRHYGSRQEFEARVGESLSKRWTVSLEAAAAEAQSARSNASAGEERPKASLVKTQTAADRMRSIERPTLPVPGDRIEENVQNLEPEGTAQDSPTGATAEIALKTLNAGESARHARAMTVAKVIDELNTIKPQLFEDEKEYQALRTRYPAFLTFEISEKRSDLKTKILAIQASTRHIRLAQEIVAAQYGRAVSTIKDDWKDYKPLEFRRLR